MRKSIVLSILLVFFSLSPSLSGHARGESYMALDLEETLLEATVEIHLEDMRQHFDTGTDFSEDPWGKIAETAPPIIEYIRENVSIGTEGRNYPMNFSKTSMIGSWENGWALYHFLVQFEEAPKSLDLRYELLFEKDRMHRNLVLWMEPETAIAGAHGEDYAEGHVAMVFGPATSEQTLDLNNIPSIRTPGDMVVEGVWHIWIGYDHILFILALLLPTVMIWRKDQNRWQPVERFGGAFWKILKVVTVFTIAHSITLALAAFEVVQLSSRLVESVIALSIVLVAVGNIIGGNFKSSILIIFVLGLFHGLGFASVMGELPFRVSGNLALKSVLLFNVGVELGQVAIVAAIFPLLFVFRKQTLYPLMMVRVASGLLAVVAAFWFIERAFGFV